MKHTRKPGRVRIDRHVSAEAWSLLRVAAKHHRIRLDAALDEAIRREVLRLATLATADANGSRGAP